MYPRRLVCAQAMWSWHPLCSVTTGERGRPPRACILAAALMLLLSLAPWHASAAMPGCRSPSQQMIDPFRARQPPPCWACVCPQRLGALYGALAPLG